MSSIIGKFKNAAVRTWKASSGFVKGGVRKIPRLVSAAFKKQTWTDLYVSFKKFSLKESDDLFGGNKKGIAKKTDHIPDTAPKKTLKNVDEPKVPSPTSKADNKLPEKQKPVNVETKEPTKQIENKLDVESKQFQSKRKISDEQYSKLRKKTPDSNARKTVNKNFKKGMPDEALPGQIVDKPLHADHIVSMDRITKMDGFEKLSEVDQIKLLNYQENFVGLSEIANKSKGAKSFSEWTEYKKLNIKVSDEFRVKMILQENHLEIQIQQKIKELLKNSKL